MSERWVKATPLVNGNKERQVYINAGNAVALGLTITGGSAIGWPGDKVLAEFVEPPEHFLPPSWAPHG